MSSSNGRGTTPVSASPLVLGSLPASLATTCRNDVRPATPFPISFRHGWERGRRLRRPYESAVIIVPDVDGYSVASFLQSFVTPGAPAATAETSPPARTMS